MSFSNGMGRSLVVGAMIATLAVTALPKGTSAAPTDQGNCRSDFPTKQQVCGNILAAWLGGRSDADAIYINGYPTTDLHDEVSLTDGKIYKTQWFERARFEQHPENKDPKYQVLLGLLGAFAAEGRKDVPFRAVDNPNNGLMWFPETKHTVGDTSEGGKAIANAWKSMGGIAQFGFPLSQPFQEVTRSTDPAFAGKSFLVQYFERQRFEYHPENKGTKFEVLLGALGNEQKGQVPVMEKAVNNGPSRDTLKLGRGQDPGSLMPYVDGTLIGSNIRTAVYNGLTKRDEDQNILPDLAAYVPTFENGGAYYVGTGDDKRLVVKYKLKRGVKWADGQEVTSNDFVFTYKLNLDPSFPSEGRSSFQKWAAVENPDQYTIIVSFLTWKEAAALISRDKDVYGFMQVFADKKIPVIEPLYSELGGFVLPEHALKNIAPDKLDGSDYSQTIWGTGPYKVTKYQVGESMTLTRNDNYNVTPTKPAVKTIFSPLFADNKALSTGMETANIDMTTSESLTPDQLPELQALEKAGKAKLINLVGVSFEHGDFVTNQGPYADVRVRQAVAYALDRDGLNKAAFGGGITFINTWVAPSSWASIENPANKTKYADLYGQLVKYTYDPAKANSLLDAAGWVKGADGMRSKGGQPLKLVWHTTTKSYRKIVAAAVVPMLQAVGIAASTDVVPSGQLFAPPPEGPRYSGKYADGVCEFAYVYTTDEMGGLDLFGETNIPSEANGFAGSNTLFWTNAESDRLLQETYTGFGHTEARTRAYLQEQVIFSKELPMLPLFALPTEFLAAPNLKGFHAGWSGFITDWQDLALQ